MRETSSRLTAPLASTETQGRSVGSEETAGFQFVLYPTDRPWVSKDARLKTKTKTVSGKGHEQFLSNLSFFIILISLCQLFKCLQVYCFEDVCVRTIVFSHFCHISTKLLIQHLSSGVLWSTEKNSQQIFQRFFTRKGKLAVTKHPVFTPVDVSYVNCAY